MTDWQNSVLTGDVRERLDDLPESSVHMCMTSPPYFGLRDYGVEDQIGLEDELQQYIDELVTVGRKLRRVLRDDGSWWLNLGDTFSGGSIVRSDGEWTRPGDDGYEEAHTATTDSDGRRSVSKLGRKNKMLVPHRVAIALQRDGWVVRNDVTWAKPNPMPQSVKDRLNTTTEQIFHLVPKPDYWYDLDAIREPYSESMRRREDCQSKHGGHEDDGWGDGNHHEGGLLDDSQTYGDTMHPAGKNPGDVFEVTTKPFPDAHFAVYPPALCEKPINATCPPKVCETCGTPYEREVEIERSPGSSPGKGDGDVPVDAQVDGGHQRDGHDYTRSHISDVETVGWSKECDCATEATESGICLDPFAGAGTTLLKAKQLGRRFVGIELNAEYSDMARARVGLAPKDPSNVRDDDDQTGLEAYADGGQNE